jgi:hypothetical protein
MKKKAIGRPRIPEKQKRKMYICFGCTASELKAIERKAMEINMTKSSFIRLAVKNYNN